MAGRRLLDAAKLYQAVKTVAKQHVALRSQQYDVYTSTSTLAKAAKEQTDRVTLTVKAGIVLAKRLAEDAPKPQQWEPSEDASAQANGDSDARARATSRTASTIDVKKNPITPVVPSEVGLNKELTVDQHAAPSSHFQHASQSSRSLDTVGSLPFFTDEAPADARAGLQHASTSYSGEGKDHDASSSGTSPPPLTEHPVPSQESSVKIEDIDRVSEPQPQDSSLAEEHTYQMRESRVPSTRLGRLWQYGGLGMSMAVGAMGESLRSATGGGGDGRSVLLSPGNLELLVAKLSRMRGAALKLGQMVSFQDIKLLPPEIHSVLQRVQDSADYMPPSQRDKVLTDNLGSDWRDMFSDFEERPIAAASIGQVHRATYRPTGQKVAVKVQYPGVAKSIDSDLNNLSILLTASKLLPKGLFLNKTIDNARTELAWECDYIREAECAIRFRHLLADDTDTYIVPEVIQAASGKTVLTAEYMGGKAVTKLPNLPQSERDWIGTHILRLCLREIVDFRFMQTDPNWTNFLFNRATHRLELLDFGASRDYPPEFIEPYIGILRAAAHNDRATVARLSVQLGYLTGDESGAMQDAHVDSVLTLSEPFGESAPEVYDFRDQTITDRVRGLIPVMLRERLAPPPEETYSLHRKLSGAFLLCARLGSRVPCRQLFRDAVAKLEQQR